MRYFATAFTLLLAQFAHGEDATISGNGIRSKALGFTGTGVVIGQVELGRPGKPNFDMPIWVHDQVQPTQVYSDTGVDLANSMLTTGAEGLHALQVAGVMIGKAAPNISLEGVAPDAILHAAGDSGGGGDLQFATTANRIALIDAMRAINVSEGRELVGLEDPDGSTHITQFVDWSARTHNVLYVVAGSQLDDPIDVPQDNYNGITVSASQPLNGGFTGTFRQVRPENINLFDPPGERTAVDIMAPGFFIAVPGQNNQSSIESGTSLAAPHVTGTVALLQQYADAKILEGAPRWDATNARRHEVMKAILLNSADKLAGIHGSTREVVNKPAEGAQNWLMTTAHTSPFVALDERLGAGHLNATAAFNNFRTGEYDSGNVLRVGWDYGFVGIGLSNDYVFDQPVAGYVAATLIWDRRIEKTGDEDFYTAGDQFFNSSVSDLDLYLLPAGTDDLNQAISRSITFDDNTEHIFFDVPQPAENYKLKVVGVAGDDEDYALAWWAGEITPGDFDVDGDADGSDLEQLLDDFGSNGRSDADNDGDSDGIDFLAWQQNLGTGVTVVAAPEPSAWMLTTFGLPMLMRGRA